MDIKNISVLHQETVESIGNIDDDTVDMEFEIISDHNNRMVSN
jgi:hypothetical protein